MPDGQVILLLQIAPSKIDTERVLPVCPELSHVLAAIVARVKDGDSRVPAVARYDPHERVMSAALPYLFQKRRGIQHVLLTKASVANMLSRAVSHAGLREVDGHRYVSLPTTSDGCSPPRP